MNHTNIIGIDLGGTHVRADMVEENQITTLKSEHPCIRNAGRGIAGVIHLCFLTILLINH